MPRPCKCRRICSVPRITRFDAAGEPHSEPVTIGLDELEVLRLLDRENLSQQQCAVRMQVSRPTVARMYENVRKKLAEALTEGKASTLPEAISRFARNLGRSAGECGIAVIEKSIRPSWTTKGGNKMNILILGGVAARHQNRRQAQTLRTGA